jgi:endonuclease/exonuclease/phosphatase family metal-dependent hydrolase
VRVATFNVLHGASLADGRADAGRLATACASLDADVLALQEVDRGMDRSGGADQAAVVATACGAADWRFVPSVGETYGIALLSRLPVRSWTSLRLPPARSVRAPLFSQQTRTWVWVTDEPRVAVCARVVAPFGEVTVAATHLSFVPGLNVWQLRRLLAAVRRLPGPYLLLGDLNLPGVLPPLLAGYRQLVRAATYPAPRPRAQLDHVLASRGIVAVRPGRAVELPVSDHRAVVVEVGRA